MSVTSAQRRSMSWVIIGLDNGFEHLALAFRKGFAVRWEGKWHIGMI